MVRDSHYQTRELSRIFAAILFILGSAATSVAAEVPPALQRYATEYQTHLAEVLGQDPDFVTRMGAQSARDLSQARLDFSSGFQMSRIDVNQVPAAHALAEIVQPTGNYYAPYCLNGTCGLMAGFRLGDDGKPAFVSAGHPVVFQEFQQTAAALQNDPQFQMVPGKGLIQFPGGHTHFSLVEDRNTHEQFLLPHSARQIAAMKAILGREPARARVLSLAEFREINTNLQKEHHDEEAEGGPPRRVQSEETAALAAPVLKNGPGLSVAAPGDPAVTAAPTERHASESPKRRSGYAWMALLLMVPGLIYVLRMMR